MLHGNLQHHIKWDNFLNGTEFNERSYILEKVAFRLSPGECERISKDRNVRDNQQRPWHTRNMPRNTRCRNCPNQFVCKLYVVKLWKIKMETSMHPEYENLKSLGYIHYSLKNNECCRQRNDFWEDASSDRRKQEMRQETQLKCKFGAMRGLTEPCFNLIT